MIEDTAVLDDGTVEQYHVDAKRLVFESTPEALAALQTEREALNGVHEMWERCQSGGNELTFPGIEWVEVDPDKDVVLELTPTLRVGRIHVLIGHGLEGDET